MYRDENDYEILYMINENSDNYKIMFEKYKPLIIKLCRKYLRKAKEAGYELDDLMQVAYIGLIDAIEGYLDNQNTIFYTYASICMENRLKTEIRNNQTFKKQVLNSALSYHNLSNHTNLSYIEIVASDEDTVLDYLESEERREDYLVFKNSLPFEMSLVLELKLNGYTSDEIGILLNMKKNTVTKYIRLIYQKIRNYSLSM